ncbi:MAG TPA: ABC transporter substrate-binding protein [Vicinamibacterales bacterium]
MGRQLRHVIAVSAVGLLAACGGKGSVPPAGASAPSRGGVLTASLRSEPPTFNRLGPDAQHAAVDAVTRLTQAPLVRINRLTDQPEPWLAESWIVSDDGRTMTLTLRDGVTFSDGQPFTSEDVVFTFHALYDPRSASALASGVQVNRAPLSVTARDRRTVVVTMAAPFAPGVAMLDNVPIYPKHLLQAAVEAGTFAKAWGVATPPAAIAGLGPFTLEAYSPGQRLTFVRNPHYWRRDAAGVQLPYLDRVILDIVKTQDAEMLRLQAGSIDLMTQADVRAEDIAALRRLRDQGSVQLVEPGVSADPNMLWFNLTPGAIAANQKTRPYLARTEFRQAVSYAVDRQAIANTLYLGAAEPVYGPITPGNRTWYSPAAPAYPADPGRARTLLAGLGLTDRDGDGMLEDAAGRPVRFSILSQAGHVRGQVATMIQGQLKKVGITADVVELDPPSIFDRYGRGDYDSIYFGFQTSALDPAMNLDFWLSSGSNHLWNAEQKTPATPWESQIDALMQRVASPAPLAERQRLFAEVQRIFGESLPAIAFVAPKVTVAMSRRVGGAEPAILDPKILWNPDVLFVRP